LQAIAGGSNLVLDTENPNNTIECKRLDNFRNEKKITGTKLIKADIERMGLEMLLRAEAIIRKNRPVLSLSIYHNHDELSRIYKTLKNGT